LTGGKIGARDRGRKTDPFQHDLSDLPELLSEFARSSLDCEADDDPARVNVK
jgi:hypothetical protein